MKRPYTLLTQIVLDTSRPRMEEVFYMDLRVYRIQGFSRDPNEDSLPRSRKFIWRGVYLAYSLVGRDGKNQKQPPMFGGEEGRQS